MNPLEQATVQVAKLAARYQRRRDKLLGQLDDLTTAEEAEIDRILRPFAEEYHAQIRGEE